ncbi:hypothetical protein GCM10009557_34230 [Virgisporangium ochraceum]|uniref:Uncharacterized protein n=1 Tax=Virgisporangium ochraceum TaxID=65505 RepID=A0A8J4A9G3_9ACTN|nr:hypothetical protein Voc01_103580 [Virgisporangium ochraceum]
MQTIIATCGDGCSVVKDVPDRATERTKGWQGGPSRADPLDRLVRTARFRAQVRDDRLRVVGTEKVSRTG